MGRARSWARQASTRGRAQARCRAALLGRAKGGEKKQPAVDFVFFPFQKCKIVFSFVYFVINYL
jgi:hypothetical protein